MDVTSEQTRDLLRLRGRPLGPCVMRQRWRDLLFLHWRFPLEEVQRTLPAGLQVDAFDGSAWIGVIPFLMRRVRPTGLPAVPGISNFLECNVRTYVHDGRGLRGVWFYRLDANQPLAVEIARRVFRLPYEHSRMGAFRRDGWLEYDNEPRGADAQRFVYRPRGPIFEAVAGSLEFFLTERYVLFACGGGARLMSGRVHHPPYRLQEAEVAEFSAAGVAVAGLVVPGREPDHAVYSRGVDVRIHALT